MPSLNPADFPDDGKPIDWTVFDPPAPANIRRLKKLSKKVKPAKPNS